MGNSQDSELLNIFLEEATDLLASLSIILREWEKDIYHLGKIAELKRELHTLKGSARMVSQAEIATLGHEMETLCEALSKGRLKVDRDVFATITLGLDQISLMVEAIKKRETLPSTQALVEKFHHHLKGSGSEIEDPAEEKSTESPLSSSFQTKTATESVWTASHEPTEIIRVRSKLIEILDGLSIENNMIGVKFEEQMLTFSNHLRALKNHGKHLESQLNSLRIEIEHYASEADMLGKRKIITSETNQELKNSITLGQFVDKAQETTLNFNHALKELSESQSFMETLLLNHTRIATELQHRLSDTRLVPFDSIVPRLSRIARQVSGELKKEVHFQVLKTEGEIDRVVLEHLVPSLEHILRNAIDHGIETAEERRQRHKPEIGKIEISFTRIGSMAAIEIKDDGRGMDPNVIRAKALELGLLTPDQKINDQEVLRYILEAGFSTRDTITELSGRGVGMDVVANAVKVINGTLKMVSTVGTGTQIIIRFPLMTSLNRILLFSVAQEVFGILLSDMSGIVNLSAVEFQSIIAETLPIFKSSDKSYHLHALADLLNLGSQEIKRSERKHFPVILMPSPEFPLALMVEEALNSRELLVQSLGAQFRLAEVCRGATLLGDGRVVYILEPEALRKKAKDAEEQKRLHSHLHSIQRNNEYKKHKLLVMVVDDSVSARAVAKGFLEKHHYQVVTAKDGQDALQQLKNHKPDLFLIDVDMPKMDGFELAATLLADKRYQKIPIIVLTALVNPERRQLAKDMQLHGFLAKPYEEAQLLLSIQSLIGVPS